MALADPQSVTVNAVPASLPRTGMSSSSGEFTSASGQTSLTVKHDSSRRTRHTVKLMFSAIVADPLVPSVNQNVSYSAHIVIDLPKNGVVAADAVSLANGLVAWATPANLTKVVGGES